VTRYIRVDTANGEDEQQQQIGMKTRRHLAAIANRPSRF